MSRDLELAQAFSRARPRLVRVAYAVLGSVVEAEDVVSDVWLRLLPADAHEPVQDVDAWATLAVARRALDVLRSARQQRQAYVGPWLPEPLLDPPLSSATADPADRVSLDDTVSYALLVLLERLSPAERTAFVLHDLFAVPFGEVAVAVGRSPAAVRQLAARARRHVSAGVPRVAVERGQHTATVAAFARAAVGGDLAALLLLLDPDVTLTSDGGGQVNAARRPVLGADRVARFLLGVANRAALGQRLVALSVNDGPALGLLDGDQLVAVAVLTLHERRVRRVDLILAPDKLVRARPAAAQELP